MSYPSVHPSVRLSVCLSVCVFVHLSHTTLNLITKSIEKTKIGVNVALAGVTVLPVFNSKGQR